MSIVEKDLNPDTFIGIALPLQHGSQGFFDKTKTMLEQTKSNIRNLLLTIKGERLGNPTFGSDLMRIIFEPDAGNINDRIEESIRSSIAEWLPAVNIRNVEISTSAQNPHMKVAKILFTISSGTEVVELELNGQS